MIPSDPRPRTRQVRGELGLLLGITALLTGARLYAATHVGYGDSEALYASYALHPQPAYLDHPGLVGAIARILGGGTAPSPARAHLLTTVVAALVPWEVALGCRAAGAPWARSWVAASVFAVVPEFAIGLFAMTPDLLLAPLWIGAVALAAAALRMAPGRPLGAVAWLGAGVLAGCAATAKVTGVLLLGALAVTCASPEARAHAKRAAPWAGIAAGLLIVAPVFVFEQRSGWPMLRHRLVETQSGAGPSFRNALAFLGGQLVYLSPPIAVLAAGATPILWRRRIDDSVGFLLAATSAVPAAVLVPLCLWSRVAEPHWVAPALLALAPAAARAEAWPHRRWVATAIGVAGAMVAVVYAWVLLPSALRLAPPSYDPRLDITNELYGWPQAIRVVREEVAEATAAGAAPGDVTVVGPHWVVCAQLDAALRGRIATGCATPVRDDFDDWWPRQRWSQARSIVWVTDARFGPAPSLTAYTPLRTRSVAVERGGRTVRTFNVTLLQHRP